MPRVQQKRGTAADLTSVNPTPLAGELLVVSDENSLKVGNGSDAYTSLAYVTATPRAHTHLFSEISDITFSDPLADNSIVVYSAGVGWVTASTIGLIGVGSQPLGGWPSGSIGAALAGKASATHASTHATGGSDALSPSDIGAAPAASPTFTGDVTIDDKIVHAGDTNTFIRFGASDTFSITTAGTTRLHCDSSGRVGIQNSSPVVTLDVGGPIAARSLITAHQTNAAIFDFAGGAARIRAYGATAGTGVIDFRTGGGGDSADAQAMRIDASQNVGIGTGTATPASRLEVNGVITVSAGSAAAPALTISGDSNTGLYQASASANTLSVSTDGTERVRFKATGAVRFIPLSADPGTADAGDVYYNSSTNKLRVYDGSNWVDLN